MSDEPTAGNPASSIPEEAVKAAGSIIYADIHALLDAGADRIECNPIGRRVLEAALPRLLAEVSAHRAAHRAEQDAVHADLSRLLRVLGMGDHARPQSSHEVMLEAISEAGRIRLALERAEVLVAERDRQWAEALLENERLRRAVADRNADIGWLGGMPDD